jgi:type II secretory pathway component GspD/PulD (secretin)
MHRIGRNTTGLLPLVLLATLTVAPAVAHDAEATDQVIKVVRLKHLDTKSAVTVLRSIFQTRQIAELPDRDIIIFRDSADGVEQSAKLLREIDVPAPTKQESTRKVGTEVRDPGAGGA